LTVHPDKQQDKGDEEFQILQRAKEILTDPSKRKHYDTYLSVGAAIPLNEWMNSRERLKQVCFSNFLHNEPIFDRFYSNSRSGLRFVPIN
jgi:DnaJ-class molecular chaperone